MQFQEIVSMLEIIFQNYSSSQTKKLSFKNILQKEYYNKIKQNNNNLKFEILVFETSVYVMSF